MIAITLSIITQFITVNDDTDPTASNPAPLTVQCIEDVPLPDVSVVTDEADNCSAAPAVAFVSDVPDGNTCPLIITRTYSVTDDCNNSINVTQFISVNDDILPTAGNPAPVAVQCFSDVPSPDISVVNDEADNCTVNPVVAFVSDVPDGNSCPLTITRTYSVTDDCNNSINVVQAITVNDDTDPTASAPAPVSVQCMDDVPAPDITIVNDEADNCTVNPVVAFVSDVPDGNTCPLTITRTYSVTDDCNNSINVIQAITVNDDTDPTASNPAPVSVQCMDDVPAPDISVVTDEADNCTATPLVAFVSDVPDGSSCPMTINRTYSVTDDCNNSINLVQAITVNDDVLPTASNPATVVVQCMEDVPLPDISVINDEADNCTALPVVAFVSDVPDGGSCPMTITRTYSVTDDCNNSINVVQAIMVNDDIPPVIIGAIPDTTVEGCAVIDLPLAVNDISGLEALGLTISDNCTPNASLVVTSSDIVASDDCPLVIVRNYTITDACDNVSIASQTFNIIDITQPQLVNLPIPGDLGCNPPVLPACDMTVTATDNCTTTPAVSCTPGLINEDACNRSQTFTYSTVDLCNNYVSADVIYTWKVDTLEPVIICPALIVNCASASIPPYASLQEFLDEGGTVNDNCGYDANSFILINEQILGEYPAAYSITRTYGITDLCGNPGTCQQIINVPALLLSDILPLNTTLCANDSLALDGNPSGGSGDYSHVWSGDGAVYLDQLNIQNPLFSGAPAGSYDLIYTVTDENGCTSMDQITVIVNEVPVVTCPSDLSLCINNGPVTLTGGLPEGGIYAGPGVSGGIFDPAIAGAGTWVISYTYDNGCTDLCTFIITVNELPEVYAGTDQTIQYRTGTTIGDATASGIEPLTYSWTPADSLLDATVLNPTTIDLHDTTTFILTIIDGNGCQSSDEVTIFILGGPLAVNPYAVPPEICIGQSAQLFANAINGTGVYTYSWTSDPPGFTSDEANPVVSPLETTTYFVEVNDTVETVYGSVTVTVYPLPVFDCPVYGPLCEGSEAVVFAEPGVFVLDGDVIAQFDPVAAGSYTLIYIETSAHGCSDSCEFVIVVNPVAEVFAGQDQTILLWYRYFYS